MPTATRSEAESSNGQPSPATERDKESWTGKFKNNRWYCDCGGEEGEFKAKCRKIKNGQKKNVDRSYWSCGGGKNRQCGMWIFDDQIEEAKELLRVPDDIVGSTPLPPKPKSPPNTIQMAMDKAAKLSAKKRKAETQASSSKPPKIINERGNRVLDDGTSVTDNSDDDCQIVEEPESPTRKAPKRAHNDSLAQSTQAQTPHVQISQAESSDRLSTRRKGKQRATTVENAPPTPPDTIHTARQVHFPSPGSTQEVPRTFNQKMAAGGFTIARTPGSGSESFDSAVGGVVDDNLSQGLISEVNEVLQRRVQAYEHKLKDLEHERDLAVHKARTLEADARADTRKLEDLSEQMRKISAEVEATKTRFRVLEDDIVAKDMRLEELESLVNEKDEELAELRDLVNEKDTRIEQLNEFLAD